VSVREQVESSESFVIQAWWPDSRRVTDVDAEAPQTIRPQAIVFVLFGVETKGQRVVMLVRFVGVNLAKPR
jgi:hypothetical protein